MFHCFVAMLAMLRGLEGTRQSILHAQFMSSSMPSFLSAESTAGITLSGGQKARISLARAAYSQASVYLLDDPLSAVDAHVAAHLVSKCLGPQGYLSKQSRILVSHQTQFASEADLVLIMRNGEIVAAGPAADFSKEELQSATVSEKSTDWTSRSTSTATAPRAGPVGLSRAVSAHGGPKTEALELRRAISEPSEEVDGVAKEEDEERKDAEVDGEEEMFCSNMRVMSMQGVEVQFVIIIYCFVYFFGAKSAVITGAYQSNKPTPQSD